MTVSAKSFQHLRNGITTLQNQQMEIKQRFVHIHADLAVMSHEIQYQSVLAMGVQQAITDAIVIGQMKLTKVSQIQSAVHSLKAGKIPTELVL